MYEQATMGKRAIKIPFMEAVRREAVLIGHERKIRLDQIRDQLRALAPTRQNFAQIKALREEQLALLRQF